MSSACGKQEKRMELQCVAATPSDVAIESSVFRGQSKFIKELGNYL